MRNTIAALVIGVAGTALAQQAPMVHGAPGPHGAAATMPGFRPTVLLETPLIGTEQRIYRLYTIDFGPGGATPRHMHPGDEIALVTEGAVTLEMEGEPPRTFQAGQNFQPRPMTPHVARNASPTAPARVSVSSITEAGKPSTIMLPPAATN